MTRVFPGGSQVLVLRLMCVVGIALGLSACGTKETTTQIPTSYENLRIISLAYIDATKELERPPQNLEEILPHIKKGLDPKEILTSPEDGQPYVIHWNLDYKEMNPPVMAYERIGKDGKRYVCRFRMILQMDEEQFRKAPFPPGKAPS